MGKKDTMGILKVMGPKVTVRDILSSEGIPVNS